MPLLERGPGELVIAAGIDRRVVEGGVDGALEGSGQPHVDRDRVPVVDGLHPTGHRGVRAASGPQVVGGDRSAHHVRGRGDVGDLDPGDVEAVDGSGELVVGGVDLRRRGFQLVATVHAGQHLPVGVPR